MSTYCLKHLDDDSLLQEFAAAVACDRRTMAALLALIGEIDARHLFLRAGFESMKAYCMRELRLSEDAAAKRIQAARLARELPALLPAIADGRLHLTAVCTLAPRLTPSNVGEWIAKAANRTVCEIEGLLAGQFPLAESLRLDDGISPQVIVPQQPDAIPHALTHVDSPAPPIPVVVAPRVRTKIEILSPERYTLQVTLPGATHDKLRRAQELLGHAVPSGDVAQILDRALDALLGRLEKQKFGLGTKSRDPQPVATRRSIPAQIRRAVYERDAGRCAFLDKDGQRCGSIGRLEFDHVIPIARGGKTTIANLRLLCRAHNQYEAERTYGREFMKRASSRRSSAAP